MSLQPIQRRKTNLLKLLNCFRYQHEPAANANGCPGPGHGLSDKKLVDTLNPRLKGISDSVGDTDIYSPRDIADIVCRTFRKNGGPS